MQDTTKKKHGSIVSAAVIIGLLGVFLAVFLFPLIGDVYGEAAAVGFLLIYAVVIIAVIVGVIVALGQRLREIESGEEDEAKKY